MTVVAIACGHLCYYNNGLTQLNTQRFTLDFMPFLLVLMALGIQRERQQPRHPPMLWRGLILYAVLLNALALTFLPGLEAAFQAVEG